MFAVAEGAYASVCTFLDEGGAVTRLVQTAMDRRITIVPY